MRIGIIGGTGQEGGGLATRWARAGHDVFLGSRDPQRAVLRATELGTDGSCSIKGGSNQEAVTSSEVVVLAVPYSAHRGVLQELSSLLTSRILIDITVPLAPPSVYRVTLPTGKAAALEAADILGSSVAIVATLHHVSWIHLAEKDRPLEGDVLFCGNDPRAKMVVSELLADLGARPLDAGPLENAIALEALTPVLIHLNRHYRSRSAAIRITGL